MYKISVDRLTKDELEYEVKIRGIDATGTVDVLRKTLRSLLQLEKSGNTVQSSVALDSDVEISTCETKLAELTAIIATFSGSSRQTQKTESKFAHLIGRINRIPDTDPVVNEKRSSLLFRLTSLLSEYETKDKMLSNTASIEPPLDPNFNATNLASSTLASPSHPVNHSSPLAGSSQVQNPISNTLLNQPSVSNYRSVPIFKWNLKFSGTSGLSFNSFLQKVEELSVSRGASKTDLFHSASDLFESNALNYYHLISRYASDWDSLVKLMRDEFVPPNFADKLWKQILSRTQGSDEPIGIFVAAMTQLFDRMPTTVSDTLRLKVLRCNMLPFFQERLTLYDVNTPFELIELCRKLEETRIRVEEFRPPRKGNLTLEPDLDYQPVRREYAKVSGNGVVNEVSYPIVSDTSDFGQVGTSRNFTAEGNSHKLNNIYQHGGNNQDRFQNSNRLHSPQSNNRSPQNYNNNSQNYVNGSRNYRNNPQRSNNNNPNDNFHTYNRTQVSQNTSDSHNQPRAQGNSNQSLCYKCNQPNHYARNCTSQIKKCFNCGKVNFTKRTCPNCNRTNQGNGQRSQS